MCRHLSPLDTLFWFPANQLLLLFPIAVCLANTNTIFIIFGFTWQWLQPTIYRSWDVHANHYTTDTLLRKLNNYDIHYKRDHLELGITYNLTFTLSHNWLPIPETYYNTKHSGQEQTTINSISLSTQYENHHHKPWSGERTSLGLIKTLNQCHNIWANKFYFVNHCKFVNSRWFMNCLCTFVKYCCYFFPLWFVWAVTMINNNQCYLMDGLTL